MKPTLILNKKSSNKLKDQKKALLDMIKKPSTSFKKAYKTA